jgi:hypothetical protein
MAGCMMSTIVNIRPISRIKAGALGVAFSAVLWIVSPRPAAADDLLQKTVNYVFTGTVDPKDPPEIVDHDACVVVMPDPRVKRFVRYYLSRLRLDDPNIVSTYTGRLAHYQLDVENSNVVVEYLGLDKTTVLNGYRSVQIPLPGDIDQTRKALTYIAAHCKQGDEQKLPF